MSQHIVLQTLHQALTNLLPAKFCLAYSGGLDSSALLHAFSQLSKTLEFELRAVHINHHLQTASDDWAQQAIERGNAWQVPMQVLDVSVNLESGLGMEAAAREARYAAFAQNLDDQEYLVTAHHRDDQIETMLLKLLRGGGCESVAAMRGQRTFATGHLLRPLLGLPRTALLDYAKANAITWIEDPSNCDQNLARAKLRGNVLPALRAAFPDADIALAKSAQILSIEALRLRDQNAQHLQTARTAESDRLQVQPLLELNVDVRGAVIRHWFQTLNLAPPAPRHLREIESGVLASRDDAAPVVRWPGAELRRYRQFLFAAATMPTPPQNWSAENWLGNTPMDINNCGQLRVLDVLNTDALLPLGAVEVRLRKGGERMQPMGRTQHHSIKNLLQESGVPPWRRPYLPYLWRHKTLLAVGDCLLSQTLADELKSANLRLVWQPIH